MMADEAILITVGQAADLLNVSKTRAYELTSAGDLGERRFIGKRNFRLVRANVEAYAASLPTEPAIN